VAAFAVVLADFDAGLSTPVAAVWRFDAVVLLFTGVVGRTCTTGALVCRIARSGTKRVQAATKLPPTTAPSLGFGASSDGTAPATVAVGGIE
jgi:hypothetical protein